MKEITEKMVTEWGLGIVQVTQGMNGYPKGLYGAVVGFDCFDDALGFADHIGGEVVILSKRDGHDFWSNNGNIYAPIILNGDWFGDDVELVEPDGIDAWWSGKLYDIKYMEWCNPAELCAYVMGVEEIYSNLKELGDNEQLKIENDVVEVIPIECMHYHDNDVTDYMVAVIDKEW